MALRRRQRRETEQPSINAELELFEGLTSRELVNIGKFFTTIDVKEGRSVGRRGTQCQHFAVILTGQVAMSFHHSPAGVLTPGCFWGAAPLLSTSLDRRRLVSASTLVDSRIAISNPSEFSGLLHACPLIAQRIRAVADRRVEYLARAEQADSEISELQLYQVHIPIDS